MADAEISLSGGPELIDLFKQMPEKMAEKVLRGGLYAGVRVMQDHARSLVPVLDLEKGGGPHEPGFLLQNIKVSTRRRGDEISGKLGITREAYYGHFVEFGTRHAPAYPFMRPAADAAAGDAAQAVIDYASARCERELSKPGT